MSNQNIIYFKTILRLKSVKELQVQMKMLRKYRLHWKTYTKRCTYFNFKMNNLNFVSKMNCFEGHSKFQSAPNPEFQIPLWKSVFNNTGNTSFFCLYLKIIATSRDKKVYDGL